MAPTPKRQEAETAATNLHNDTLDALRQDVHDIKIALIGDEKLGHRGLIVRMTNAERIILILCGSIIFLGGERILKLLF